jgi:hypothetical protein
MPKDDSRKATRATRATTRTAMARVLRRLLFTTDRLGGTEKEVKIKVKIFLERGKTRENLRKTRENEWEGKRPGTGKRVKRKDCGRLP